jgi:hypothetical protein
MLRLSSVVLEVIVVGCVESQSQAPSLLSWDLHVIAGCRRLRTDVCLRYLLEGVLQAMIGHA